MGRGGGLPLVLFLGLLALVWPAGAACAETRVVNAREYPWSTVGRLNAAGHGFCSGVLVSERHVLTAAHCLQLPAGGRLLRPEELVFVAGFQGGDAPILSRIKAFVRADDYGASTPPRAVGDNDWAVLELREPIGRRTGWLAVAMAEPAVLLEQMNKPGVAVVLAGYRIDRSQVLTIDSGCRFRGFLEGSRLLIHDCAPVRGDSGGPLLAFFDGGVSVIGVNTLLLTGPGVGSGGAVAAAVLSDQKEWPNAIAGAKRLGFTPSPQSHPPPEGGLVAPTPAATVAALLAQAETGRPRSVSPKVREATIARLGALLAPPVP